MSFDSSTFDPCFEYSLNSGLQFVLTCVESFTMTFSMIYRCYLLSYH